MRFAAPHTHPGSHYNVICIHLLQNTQEEPIDLETIQAAPAAPFIAGCSHFTRKKTHCFVLWLPPQKQAPRNTHAAITMRFAAPRAHPCSHYNAICIHSLQNTEEEEPIGFETIQTAPAAHRRYPSSPAAATLHG